MKNFLRRLKILMKVLLGKDILVRPDLQCQTERFGSEYGGWDLVTAGLNVDSVIYSFGVGQDISFDMALIKRFGHAIHAFDPTPKSIDWVKSQNVGEKFILHEYGLAGIDGELTFNPPENPDHVSYTLLDRESTRANAISVSVKRLATVMSELGHSHIDLLKMDIEGAEYDVIDDLLTTGIRPNQLLVEFHHRFPGVGLEKTRQAIDKLRLMDYVLFSVSQSNEEYCFIQRRLV